MTNLRKPPNKDNVTLARIQKLHPKLRAEADGIYNEICQVLTGRAICRFSHTLRTFAEQKELYAQGRTKPGKKVTNAAAGQSAHNYGMAIDIVLLNDTNGDGTFETASWKTTADFDDDGNADWMEVVAIFKRHGWEWGGDWKFTDMPHFQKLNGRSITELQRLYLTGSVDKDKYVQI